MGKYCHQVDTSTGMRLWQHIALPDNDRSRAVKAMVGFFMAEGMVGEVLRFI